MLTTVCSEPSSFCRAAACPDTGTGESTHIQAAPSRWLFSPCISTLIRKTCSEAAWVSPLSSTPKQAARQGAMQLPVLPLWCCCSSFCRALGRKLCLHLFLFASYKDQLDALSLVGFFVFISGWEETTRKTDIKVPLDAPSVCMYVQPCTLRQHGLPSAQNICHPCELVHCSLHSCALNTPPKAAPYVPCPSSLHSTF